MEDSWPDDYVNRAAFINSCKIALSSLIVINVRHICKKKRLKECQRSLRENLAVCDVRMPVFRILVESCSRDTTRKLDKVCALFFSVFPLRFQDAPYLRFIGAWRSGYRYRRLRRDHFATRDAIKFNRPYRQRRVCKAGGRKHAPL